MRQLLLLVILIPSFCFAGTTGGWFQVKNVYVWSENASNHFMINLHNENDASYSVCPGGFWYGKSSEEEGHIWETVMFAYKSKTKVKIHFDESDDWPSMSVKDCKIKMIELEDSQL